MEPLTVHLDEQMIKERIFDKKYQIDDISTSIKKLKIVRSELDAELKQLKAWRETLRDQ